MAKTVAEQFVEILAAAGVKRIYGIVGDSLNGLTDAIRRSAQAASPGRQVISLSGDGGFSMLMGDFLTLAQYKLPVKVVVFNNGTLGFVELEQKSTGFLHRRRGAISAGRRRRLRVCRSGLSRVPWSSSALSRHRNRNYPVRRHARRSRGPIRSRSAHSRTTRMAAILGLCGRRDVAYRRRDVHHYAA
jgi:hypothetical protein